MPEPDKKDIITPDPEAEFDRQIRTKVARRLKSQAGGRDNVWFGLGMFGLIGWSVAIPTVLGVALGVWIDRTWPSRYSWTLMLLLLGVILGCANAWHWVSQERRKIDQKESG